MQEHLTNSGIIFAVSQNESIKIPQQEELTMRKNLRRMLASLALCAVMLGTLTVPAAAAGFQDVPANHWAGESIQRCVENGFFKGQTETRFGLGQNMSRSAFAVVLCRFFGWETGVPTEQTYPDVPVDAWYAGAVETAYQKGAITRAQDPFRPNDPITREELAVMLVRALGYGEIAGLAQDLPIPFEDVKTNGGYITMAYDLGVVNGTTATTFSPNRTATREQVAVMLMRLYDKLHSAQPEKIGIVSETADLTGLDVAALPAARVFTFGVKNSMEEELAAELQTAARKAGAKVFLYMQGSANVLDKDLKEMSAAMAEPVTAGGYDGLILDIPDVPAKKVAALADMVRLLKTALGEMPVCLVTEAPGRTEKAREGSDYAALAAAADKLILKPAALEQVNKEFVVAPVDPLEEVYYGVASVVDQIGADKVSVMLDSGLYKWVKEKSYSLSEAELAELLAAKTTKTYYSDRYACAYLTGVDKMNAPVTAWYLTAEDVETRVQLIKSMGVSQICISDWDAAGEAFLTGLN